MLCYKMGKGKGIGSNSIDKKIHPENIFIYRHHKSSLER